MRLKPHLIAPIAVGALLLGASASADASSSSFGAAINKFCSAQVDLAPIDASLTAELTSSNIGELRKFEGVIARAATQSGVANKSSSLYGTYKSMEGELRLTDHAYTEAASDLKSEKRLTKPQIKVLSASYAKPVLTLSKQFKAIGADACNH